VGNDARLPTQNTKFMVDKLKRRGGKVKNKSALSRQSVSCPPSSENAPAHLGWCICIKLIDAVSLMNGRELFMIG